MILALVIDLAESLKPLTDCCAGNCIRSQSAKSALEEWEVYLVDYGYNSGEIPQNGDRVGHTVDNDTGTVSSIDFLGIESKFRVSVIWDSDPEIIDRHTPDELYKLT